MSKEIKINLEYTDKKGKDVVKMLKIKKVFNWALESFDEMNTVISEVSENFKEIQLIDKKIDIVYHDLKDDWYEERQKLIEEKKELTKKIKSVGKSTYFKKRFELASGILKDNGYNDEFLHDFDFWNKKVEPDQLINFINLSIFKDMIEGTIKGKK